MFDVEIDNAPRVNVAALTVQLKAAFGDALAGVSGERSRLRVHFTVAPTAAARDRLESVLAAHDPDALTPEQQQAAALRQAEVDARPKALAVLNDLTDGWPALTAAQKVDAIRTALVWLLYRELRRGA